MIRLSSVTSEMLGFGLLVDKGTDLDGTNVRSLVGRPTRNQEWSVDLAGTDFASILAIGLLSVKKPHGHAAPAQIGNANQGAGSLGKIGSGRGMAQQTRPRTGSWAQAGQHSRHAARAIRSNNVSTAHKPGSDERMQSPITSRTPCDLTLGNRGFPIILQQADRLNLNRMGPRSPDRDFATLR